MLLPTEINPSPTPHELCGYPVERVLTPDQGYLASGPGGRKVVLKRVDEDCLLRGKLHPSIKDRLARVRELAHAGVANLHGVERDGDTAWLVWEFVEGRALGEFLSDAARSQEELLTLARELILAVDALHAQGIVHGALIGGNVIVTPEGGVRLTHVSPLLYTDTDVDIDCVLSLLEDAVESRGQAASAFSELLSAARREGLSLRAIASRLAALLEVRTDPARSDRREDGGHIRRRTLLAAGVVLLVGIVIAYVIFRAVGGSSELRNAFHGSQETSGY